LSKQSRQRQQRQAASLTTNQKRGKSIWAFIGLVSIAVVASVIIYNHQKVGHPFNSKANAPPGVNPEQEIDAMLQGTNENIDLALANWLMVAEIPEFQNLTREDYFTQLDDMTKQVQQKMAKMQSDGWPNANSDNPETRCRRFCSAIIGLHFEYAEQFNEENLTPMQMKAMYSNPDNIFLAGLLRTKQGTCVSMPLIYLVIGQRLGMPVRLVEIGRHYFIRWDEPQFRMDIETTIVSKIAWTPDESVYLDTENMTRDQLRGSDLRSLTNREVIGELFFARTSYWHGKGADFEGRSRNDLVQAHNLAPDDPGIEALYQHVFNFHGIQPLKSTATKSGI
jgi:hypothetical protein